MLCYCCLHWDSGPRWCFVRVHMYNLSPNSSLLSLEVVMNIRTININGVCEVYYKYPQMDVATLIYSEFKLFIQTGVVLIESIQATFYDLLVFVLSAVRLSRERSKSPLKRRLRAQGILYFAAAVIAYIPPSVGSPYYPIPCSHCHL